MHYFEQIKEYLLELGADITFEEADTGIFIITLDAKGVQDMILDCEGDILILEQIILPIRNEQPSHYKQLLQMNRSMVHGAFVLNDSQDYPIIAFRDTLQLPCLDLNELEGTLNALTFALVENYEALLAMSS